MFLAAGAVIFLLKTTTKLPRGQALQTVDVILPGTNFDGRVTIPNTTVGVSYPTNGFYGLGVKFLPYNMQNNLYDVVGGMGIVAPSPIDQRKASEYIDITLDIRRINPNGDLYSLIRQLSDSSWAEYRPNGLVKTIGDNIFYIVKTTSEQSVIFDAYTARKNQYFHIAFQYSEAYGSVNSAAANNNETLFYDYLKNINIKDEPLLPESQEGWKEYTATEPGFFYDPATDISLNYPKTWTIKTQYNVGGLDLRFSDAAGRDVAGLVSFEPGTGFEDSVKIGDKSYVAKDGAAIKEELYRTCGKWSADKCLEPTGPLFAWAMWHETLLSLYSDSGMDSAAEKQDLNDFESILPTLNIAKQPASAETVTYNNTLLGYSITYPASWLSHPNAFASPPDDTQLVPDVNSDWVFVGPKYLLSNCLVIAPPMPARYINIISLDGNLVQNRKNLNQKIAGQDNLESTIQLSGKTVYVYTPRYSTQCPNGDAQQFKTYLFENKNKIFELMTDLYNQTDIRDAINSIKFF